MAEPSGEASQLSIAAVIRELRRGLAELEAAEDKARSKRQHLIAELDRLVERVQQTESESIEVAPAPPVQREAPARATTKSEGEVPRVLIAEDSPSAGRIACRLVERMGYAVELVKDGVEALERLGSEHYDAVLMDCKMPRMDGYQTTRAIRQLPGEASSVPVIALTSNTLEGDDLRCFVAGMDDYLAKPVHAGQLEESLRRWVDGGARLRA
jgi:CheY-like chemotaxis protein